MMTKAEPQDLAVARDAVTAIAGEDFAASV